MPGYAELHAHSCYSLGDAVPFPDELAERAATLGLRAIALTEHDAIYAAVPFFHRAKEVGVKPLLGAEMTLDDGHHLTLLAKNQAGYGNLCALITTARMNAKKGQALLPWSALTGHVQGLLCLTGCKKSPVAARLAARNENGAQRALDQLVNLFGRLNVYVELQRHRRPGDVQFTRRLAELATTFRLPYVATGNVHYLAPEDGDLQDVLVSVRERKPLAQIVRTKDPSPQLRPNHEYYLRSSHAMAELYADLPGAVERTLEVAERCRVVLPNGLQVLPQFPTPDGIPAIAYLRQLCEAELPKRYPRTVARARMWLDKELTIIDQWGLANYFLILFDLIQFCQSHSILAHGRGSAANSLVAYLGRISAIDPIAHNLVLERFISVEHGGTPDVDIDLPSGDEREAVIQYVYKKYGLGAAMACTYVTYRAPSAIRDVGFALGLKRDAVELIAQSLERERHAEQLDEDGRVELPDLPIVDQHATSNDLSTQRQQLLVALAEQLRKRPRHLGLHNGGMIVADGHLSRLIPIEPAAMLGRSVVQWDKDALESSGIVKIDLLGLRMLAAISDAVELIWQTQRKRIDLHTLDLRDPKVYDVICSGSTIGLFQVESPSQASLIPKLRPRSFHDLMIQVSLIRPGPLQAGMVRPYLRRRSSENRRPIFIHYSNPHSPRRLALSYGKSK